MFYPDLVTCECIKYATSPDGETKNVYDSRCMDEVRKAMRWYLGEIRLEQNTRANLNPSCIGNGVSTLRPQDVWLADAKEYWVNEEECKYTHPYNYDNEKIEAIALGRLPTWTHKMKT
jgi:hypothetical protein